MKRNWIIEVLFCIVFLGSVFLTSEKFVNATNSPKNYFVLVSLLVLILFAVLKPNPITFRGIMNKAFLWGISTVCFIQAGLGFIQFMGWLPSNHSSFSVTGNFDNPAGFAAVLTLGFPVGVFLYTREKGVRKQLSLFTSVVIAFIIVLSGSRTGIFAIMFSTAVLLFYRTDLFSRLMSYRFSKFALGLLIVAFVFGSIVLFQIKKGSAFGRLLIWLVSAEMIKDKPLFGHGYGAFQANYMDYQAEYFKGNPNSAFALFADNVKHPFNEFIKVTVEFGLIGLAIIILLIVFVFCKILKTYTPENSLILSGIVSFLVFACFSYPLQYAAVWLLLAFYLSALFSGRSHAIGNIYLRLMASGTVCFVCVFALVHVYKQIQAEVKWKSIAMSALRVNTKLMLDEYELLYQSGLKQNPYFLYNYGAELNISGEFERSIVMLDECQQRFNDYDLQMLFADCYNKKGDQEKAVYFYNHASDMIPCRFLPLYKLFEVYKSQELTEMALKYAEKILEKKVKIQSGTVVLMKSEVYIYKENTKCHEGR